MRQARTEAFCVLWDSDLHLNPLSPLLARSFHLPTPLALLFRPPCSCAPVSNRSLYLDLVAKESGYQPGAGGGGSGGGTRAAAAGGAEEKETVKKDETMKKDCRESEGVTGAAAAVGGGGGGGGGAGGGFPDQWIMAEVQQL